MNRRGNVAAYALIGVLAALSLALTTDQIIQNVYDSANSSMKVKIVSGSAVSPAGSVGNIQVKASATALGAYPGSDCLAGNAVQALDASGVPTCVSVGAGTVSGSGTAGLMPVWVTTSSLGDSNAFPILVTNDTVTGTTVNKLVKFTSAGRAIITSAAETSGILGVVKGGAGSSGSAQVTTIGGATCISDNATTAGHFVGVSASTAGSCTDLGATFPTSGTQVLGTWTETGAAGARTMFFNTSDVASVSSGGGGGGAKNPGGAAGDVQYRATGNNFAAEAAFNYNATNDKLTLTSAPPSGDFSLAVITTSTGTSASGMNNIVGRLNAGYTGSALTSSINAINSAAGTGNNLNLNVTTDPVANLGTYSVAAAVTTGAGIGVYGYGTANGPGIGVYGKSAGTGTDPQIGVLGNAANSAEGTNLKNVAGYFTLGGSLITGSNISVALLADNGAVAAPIFNAYDNGSLVFSITDGGPVTMTSTLKSTATADLGWTVQNAANQACNTTCTTGACVVGIDTITTAFLGCTDATADSCLCAG